MADLLECVLQIKGLRETVGRLRTLAGNFDSDRWEVRPAVGQPTAAELVSRLAEMELVHGAALRLMLTIAHPHVPNADENVLKQLDARRRWSGDEALERFLARRRDNLELLERCTADDMARKGAHPTRRDITVADLVAVMLATDVEHYGEIRRILRA